MEREMNADASPTSNEEFQPSDPRSVEEEAGDGAAEKRKREEEEEKGERRKALWKTSLCSYYRQQPAGGRCSHGDACRYAHGEAELRPRPDNTWDPTSQRAKKLLKSETSAAEEEDSPPVSVDATSLDKCLIGLPRKWTSDSLKSFLDAQDILYKTAKKKKGMSVGFVGFENIEQVKSAIEVLNENSAGGKQIKVADAVRRCHEKKPSVDISSDQSKGQNTESHPGSDDPTLFSTSSTLIEDGYAVEKDTSVVEGLVSKTKHARDVVTPLANMPYNDQLEHKKSSLLQILKRLTRNARKACPDVVPLPEWINTSREIGGLPCKLEGILESPVINGYRNKCEFSVGCSLQGKRTVGFMLGNFREGITAVEEPVNCPNVSRISCKYASIFQDFLQSSVLPVWNRINNTGFWRQFTVREGRSPGQAATENLDNQITEVMLIVQVCLSGVDEELMKNEFSRMTQVLTQGAASCSPPLPLTTIVVQDHKGISNAAPADCPLLPLLLSNVEKQSCSEKPYVSEARIHDYISNLRFSISPTAFFQVNTLAAERLYSLAGDWADLNSDTLLFDICCGTGTIGLTLAHHVGMVVGIEMNESAVSDAQRNAMINGIKNCRFVCGKAEDVMGTLLKQYLDVPQHHGIVSGFLESNGTDQDDNITNDNGDGLTFQSDTSTSADDLLANASAKEISVLPEERTDGKLETLVAPEQNFDGNTNHEEGCIDHGKDNGHESLANEGSNNDAKGSLGILKNCTAVCEETTHEKPECIEMIQNNCISEPKKGAAESSMFQFKNVVAIVDPPRVGLHPIVIKSLRTHPRIRRLVYISCNPESLVANAIELCTPTTDKPEKGKGNRGWRKMSSAGLARNRVKSMPNSEPFRPVRAMAVDLFPHTPHCEMVMLFER
ncbi:zinc finger CCCH domain-containing protein 24 [Phoenix dactylifera]|uniref:Zinc finger CCCH domain-containing protein 24 n=1 Tax=Phoenix dactylifera TaxID=42345 RepID=A0A8B7C4E2_PHODC|nr:zinc finger CCCH domain-containing protein 24 [Phoenix dactylifera]